MSEIFAPKTVALFLTEANIKLIAELKSRGDVIELPKVSAVKSETFSGEINPLDYDWIIFPDTTAADIFLENLGERNFDFYELDAVRICAYGEAVSDRLRFVQVHADVIPSRLNTENIFSALRDYISSEADFAGLRFLIIKEENSAIELSEILRNLKSDVTEIPLYKFQAASTENLTKLKTLLKGGAADEIVFNSPFDATALRYLFGERLTDLLKEIQISATDEVTFQTLIEHGLRPLYFRK